MLVDLENAYGSWEHVGWLPYTDIKEAVFAKSSMLQRAHGYISITIQSKFLLEILFNHQPIGFIQQGWRYELPSLCTISKLQFPMYFVVKDHIISFYCCEKCFLRYATYILKEMDDSFEEAKMREIREIVNKFHPIIKF